MFTKNLQTYISSLKRKGSFSQNVGVVFLGNLTTVLIQFISAPILSRIFSPEAYGEFAYYSLIFTNLVFFSSLSLPSIYVICKHRLQFLTLGWLVLLLTFCSSTLAAVLYFFSTYFFDLKQVSFVAIGLLYLTTLLGAYTPILESLNIRKKEFKKNTLGKVISSVLQKVGVAISGFYVIPSGPVLFSGELIKQLTLLFSLQSLKSHFLLFRFFLKRKLSSVFNSFKEQHKIPKYVFPSQILNRTTNDLPILMIGGFYGSEVLGYYTFMHSILNVPVTIISSSIQPVFIQKVSELFHTNKAEISRFFRKIFLLVLSVSVIPLLIISFWGPTIFSLVFGEEWEFAGTIATLTIFFYQFQMVAGMYGGIRRVLGLEKKILILSILGTAFRLAPLILLVTDVSFEFFIYIFSVSKGAFIALTFIDLFFTLFYRKEAIKLTCIVILVTTIYALFPVFTGYFL